jgi:hypothetical protein
MKLNIKIYVIKEAILKGKVLTFLTSCNSIFYLSLDQNVTQDLSQESNKSLEQIVDSKYDQVITPVKHKVVVKELDLKVDKKEEGEKSKSKEIKDSFSWENDKFMIIFTCSILLTLFIVIILYYRHK